MPLPRDSSTTHGGNSPRAVGVEGPASNPFMDDHLVYAGVLVALAWFGRSET